MKGTGRKDVVGQYRHEGVAVSADSGAPQPELSRLINSVRTELPYRVVMVKGIERASDVDCKS